MKTQIVVRGRRYTVQSDDDIVDLARVASFVDGRMAEIAERTPRADEYTIAMLAALNIAQDFERFRVRVDRELSELDRELASTAVLLEAALPVEES
jgi:cell division protein ZapA (FtsZ GTPase activity inhibitor)